MPPRNHLAHWPDKAMFSALCLVLGGGLGLVFELGRGLVVTSDKLNVFTEQIPFYTMVLTAATLVLGLVCLRTQAALFGYLGAATAIASVGLFGLVSFLGVASIAFMVKAHLEGEETRNDGIRLRADEWPDKAMAAAMVLFVAGSLSLVQGIAIALGQFTAPLLPAALALPLDLAGGLAIIVAAREVFHLRRAWSGILAGMLCILSLGIYVLGPLLGVAALILLRLAGKEGEFEPQAQVRAQLQQDRRRQKVEPMQKAS